MVNVAMTYMIKIGRKHLYLELNKIKQQEQQQQQQQQKIEVTQEEEGAVKV